MLVCSSPPLEPWGGIRGPHGRQQIMGNWQGLGAASLERVWPELRDGFQSRNHGRRDKSQPRTLGVLQFGQSWEVILWPTLLLITHRKSQTQPVSHIP